MSTSSRPTANLSPSNALSYSLAVLERFATTGGEYKQLQDSWDTYAPGVFTWIQAWYATQANGEWEHEYGIEISTLDNPGWQVSIDLPGTLLGDRPYEPKEVHRGEHDWIVTKVEGGKFVGACGPTGLGEVLYRFRLWVEGAEEDPSSGDSPS